jgi:rhombotail lipoprotein
VDNFNDAAVLYWTLIGIWLVPGNVFEHRTVVQGILLDTRTGAILGTATGDAHLKRLTPLAFVSIQRDKLSREAPAQAMDDFQKAGKTLLEDVARTAAKPPA